MINLSSVYRFTLLAVAVLAFSLASAPNGNADPSDRDALIKADIKRMADAGEYLAMESYVLTNNIESYKNNPMFWIQLYAKSGRTNEAFEVLMNYVATNSDRSIPALMTLVRGIPDESLKARFLESIQTKFKIPTPPDYTLELRLHTLFATKPKQAWLDEVMKMELQIKQSPQTSFSLIGNACNRIYGQAGQNDPSKKVAEVRMAIDLYKFLEKIDSTIYWQNKIQLQLGLYYVKAEDYVSAIAIFDQLKKDVLFARDHDAIISLSVAQCLAHTGDEVGAKMRYDYITSKSNDVAFQPYVELSKQLKAEIMRIDKMREQSTPKWYQNSRLRFGIFFAINLAFFIGLFYWRFRTVNKSRGNLR